MCFKAAQFAFVHFFAWLVGCGSLRIVPTASRFGFAVAQPPMLILPQALAVAAAVLLAVLPAQAVAGRATPAAACREASKAGGSSTVCEFFEQHLFLRLCCASPRVGGRGRRTHGLVLGAPAVRSGRSWPHIRPPPPGARSPSPISPSSTPGALPPVPPSPPPPSSKRHLAVWRHAAVLRQAVPPLRAPVCSDPPRPSWGARGARRQ